MVEILRPEKGATVYDPTCGSGGMLLEAVHYMERQGLSASALTLYGQESNLNTWAICKMSLFLHDIDDAFIERGDTLLDPKHTSSDNTIKQFDLVIANPPFSLKNWGHKVWSKGDTYGRDTFGCPPKSYGDLAFIQHMIASLTPNGRMAVVCPHGVLFRGGEEGKIRKGMLDADLIEAVVGLGGNLFYGTGIPAAVLFINKNKPAERKGKVLIVNGDKDIVEGKNQNSLSDENVEKLAHAVQAYEDQELFCRVVSLEEIVENDHNLNLTRYVQTDPPPPPIDVKAEVAKLTELMAQRDEAMTRLPQGVGLCRLRCRGVDRTKTGKHRSSCDGQSPIELCTKQVSAFHFSRKRRVRTRYPVAGKWIEEEFKVALPNDVHSVSVRR